MLDNFNLLICDWYQSFSKLRQLFAHMLLRCEVADEAELFATLACDDWGADFARQQGRFSHSPEVKEMVFLDLRDTVARVGQTLDSCNMPLPQG